MTPARPTPPMLDYSQSNQARHINQAAVSPARPTASDSFKSKRSVWGLKPVTNPWAKATTLMLSAAPMIILWRIIR